jgi:hypothetical protein
LCAKECLGKRRGNWRRPSPFAANAKPAGINRRVSFIAARLRDISVAGVDPGVAVPNDAGIRVVG